MLQHRERSHLAQKLAEMHLRGRLPASKRGPCLYSYDELGVADGKVGREPLPGAARFFHHITVLGKGHLLLRCKILRRPLDFPAGVVYSKGNFILNKTLRQTIHAGTRKRENRRRIWRGASGFAGGQHSYHCRVRRRTFAGVAPRYRRLQNRALGLCFTSGMLCRVQFGWNRGV